MYDVCVCVIIYLHRGHAVGHACVLMAKHDHKVTKTIQVTVFNMIAVIDLFCSVHHPPSGVLIVSLLQLIGSDEMYILLK